MDFIALLSAFGLGAVVAALLQSWLTHRSEILRRDFQEKKESYVGFLDALHKSEMQGTTEAAHNAGHWRNRIELVGSGAVIAACLRIQSTNPIGGQTHPDRPSALRDLKDAMRSDLGVGH